MKGGGTGGGASQVVPSDDINMHFTGDFHAVTSAHNLLAAMVDNHLHHGNALGHRPAARARGAACLDMNDRALRRHRASASAAPIEGVPRETGFDITAASEVMAILCLASRHRGPEGAPRRASSSATAPTARRSPPAT